jgi:hypothetical protein
MWSDQMDGFFLKPRSDLLLFVFFTEHACHKKSTLCALNQENNFLYDFILGIIQKLLMCIEVHIIPHRVVIAQSV